MRVVYSVKCMFIIFFAIFSSREFYVHLVSPSWSEIPCGCVNLTFCHVLETRSLVLCLLKWSQYGPFVKAVMSTTACQLLLAMFLCCATYLQSNMFPIDAFFNYLFDYELQENLNIETLQQQFLIVKKETNTSHVMEYGDMVSLLWLTDITRRSHSFICSRRTVWYLQWHCSKVEICIVNPDQLWSIIKLCSQLTVLECLISAYNSGYSVKCRRNRLYTLIIYQLN